jgi:hypothetical protein
MNQFANNIEIYSYLRVPVIPYVFRCGKVMR